MAVPDPRPRDPRRAARGDRLHDRRRRACRLEGRDRPAAGAARAVGRLPRGRREELVAHGRRRAVRAVLGAPLRPRRAPLRRARVHPRPQRALPALARGLEPRVHGVRAPPRPEPDAAARAGRGHRPGPRADRERRAGRGQQLRHRPVRADPRPDARAPGPRPGGLRGRAVQLPGHRGPLPRGDLPRRGRRPALERGPRLRPPADPAPSRAPRPAPRADGAVPRRDGEGRDRDDVRRLPASRGAPGGDPGHDRTRGAPVQPHARGRHRSARGGADPPDLRRAGRRAAGRDAAGACARAAGRRRVPAPRHLRVPDRPHGRARGRVRGAHRPRGLRGRARRAAGAQPGGHEGRPRADRRARLPVQRAARPHGSDRVRRLRVDDRGGAGARDPPRRHRVRDARGAARGRAAIRGLCPRGARARPDARSTRRAGARSRTSARSSPRPATRGPGGSTVGTRRGRSRSGSATVRTGTCST